MNDLVSAIVARWTDPDSRPLFKGKLIDNNGCCCAQGDILRHECKMSDQGLQNISDQTEADEWIAKLLGISMFHAVLLRVVNDNKDGCPQDVLSDPEKVLGPQWHRLLSFGWHIDSMTTEQWNAIKAVEREVPWIEAREIVSMLPMKKDISFYSARDAISDIAWTTAWATAKITINEIIGAQALRDQEREFYFLPLFGFATPEDIPLVDVFQNKEK